MKVSFFYAKIDVSLENMMLLYNGIAQRIKALEDVGIFINLVDVNAHDLEFVSRVVKESDVVLVDAMIIGLVSHPWGKVPNNAVAKGIKGFSYYLDVYKLVLESSACKIFFARAIDLHWHDINIPSLKHFDAIFWLYEKRPQDPQSVPEQYQDSWFFEHENPLDVWNTVTSLGVPRADIAHCINPEHAKKDRKFFDYTISGCNYATRLLARKSLGETNLRKAPYDIGEFFASQFPQYFSKLGFSADSINKKYIGFRQLNYRKMIEYSHVAFACGSGLGYPVRKFFQIPNYSTLLLAHPCVGFRDFGFVDGENCLETIPEEAGETAEKILKNPNLLEKITRKGWQFVTQEHSVENRANQIIECIKRVYKGKSINAQYKEGKYEISEYASS